jgi:hypothetical protein
MTCTFDAVSAARGRLEKKIRELCIILSAILIDTCIGENRCAKSPAEDAVGAIETGLESFVGSSLADEVFYRLGALCLLHLYLGVKPYV